MSRRRPVLLGFGSLGVTLAVILLVTPSGAMGCPPSQPIDFHDDDGQWIVLMSEGCTYSSVSAYSSQWGKNGRANLGNQINMSDGHRPSIVGFVSASNDGWWFVSANGRAYKFSSDFEYENRMRRLPSDLGRYMTGMAVDKQGRWWITTRTATTVYEPESNETVRTFKEGANDIEISGNRLVLLQSGRKGGFVLEYDVQATSDGTRKLSQRTKHELGPEIFHPAMIAKKPGGRWWIYSQHGWRFAYDQNWRYTGEQSRSFIHGIFFLFPALFVSFVGFWPIAWRVVVDDSSRRPLLVYVGAGAVAAGLAISVRESLVPPALSFVYWPPDPLVAVLLALPTVFGVACLERRSPFRVTLVGIANLPLLVVAWDFLSSVG